MDNVNSSTKAQDRLVALSPLEFERFLVALLQRQDRFLSVDPTPPPHLMVDVSALDRNGDSWYFEAKALELVGSDVIERFAQIKALRLFPGRFVLATSGHATAGARKAADALGIEIWDGRHLENLAPPDLLLEFFAVAERRSP